MMTPIFREKIITGADTDSLETIARKEGMLTFIEDGIIKALQGVTTFEEVMRVAKE